MGEQQRYFAYLVRLWTVRCNGEWVWRASADNAHTGEHHAFADLGQMATFLVTLAQDDGGTPPTDATDAPSPHFMPPVSGP